MLSSTGLRFGQTLEVERLAAPTNVPRHALPPHCCSDEQRRQTPTRSMPNCRQSFDQTPNPRTGVPTPRRPGS